MAERPRHRVARVMGSITLVLAVLAFGATVLSGVLLAWWSWWTLPMLGLVMLLAFGAMSAMGGALGAFYAPRRVWAWADDGRQVHFAEELSGVPPDAVGGAVQLRTLDPLERASPREAPSE